MAATAPATEAQLRYLADLTTPARLATLTSSEARYLIAFLRGAPPNASRAQQLFLLGLLERLPRSELHDLIADLAEREQQRKVGEGSQEPVSANLHERAAPPARPAPSPAAAGAAAGAGLPHVTRERWTPGQGQRSLPVAAPSRPAPADELPPGVDLASVF